MNDLIVTVDLDWACEPAIEDTLNFLKNHNISPTVFVTHRSSIVEAALNEIEVALHPYFAPDSSHGSTIVEVVNYIMELPHNLSGFRCHRFANCNLSRHAMVEAGMLISSNICTDMEVIPPFKDRFGLLEVPIFLEDGGYLWRKHPLEISKKLERILLGAGQKVIVIHPMHFSVNTPYFGYMYNIKESVGGRANWKNMSSQTLNNLRWHGRGIRNLLVELLQIVPHKSSLGDLYRSVLK